MAKVKSSTRSNTTGTGGVASPGNLAKSADSGTGGEYPKHLARGNLGTPAHREIGTPTAGMGGNVAKEAGSVRQNTPGQEFTTPTAPDAIKGVSNEQLPPTEAAPIRQHIRMAGGG